jgi:hypothetical protein
MEAFLEYLNSIYPLSAELQDFMKRVMTEKWFKKKEFLLKEAGFQTIYILFQQGY